MLLMFIITSYWFDRTLLMAVAASSPLCLTSYNKFLYLLVRLLQIVIHNNLIMRRVSTVGKVHFHLGLVETFKDILFLVRCAAS